MLIMSTALRSRSKLVALVAAVAFAIALIMISQASPLPGISIAVEGLGTDEIASVFVVATAPPTRPGDFVELYVGHYDGRPIYFSSKGQLGQLAREWIESYRARGNDVGGLEVGLIVFVSIFNRTALKVGDLRHAHLFTTADVVSFRPADVVAGRSLLYVVRVERGRHGFARVERREILLPTSVRSADERTTGRIVLSLEPESPEVRQKCFVASGPDLTIYDCWERTYYVGAENLSSARHALGIPDSYFVQICGRTYMRVPVLIVENEVQGSLIGASIDLAATEASICVYATLGYTSGWVDMTLWKSSMFVWGGQKYLG